MTCFDTRYITVEDVHALEADFPQAFSALTHKNLVGELRYLTRLRHKEMLARKRFFLVHRWKRSRLAELIRASRRPVMGALAMRELAEVVSWTY